MMKASKSSTTTSGKVISGSTSTTTNAPVATPVARYKPPVRAIPGMPVGAPPVVKPTNKPKPPKSDKSKTPMPPPVPVVDVAENKEKKIKNLNKKLRQIIDLEEKKATGIQMNSEQQSKISSKTSVEAEIASLSI